MLDINVTEGVKAHYAGDIVNSGFIVKLEDRIRISNRSSNVLKILWLK